MFLDVGSIVVLAIVTITIIISSIAIIIAIKIQKTQRKKYIELKQILEAKSDAKFEYKDSLTDEDIKKVDSNVDINILMRELYNTYLEYENKMKSLDNNLDDLLSGEFKNFCINKVNNFKTNGYADIKDGIELNGYSISEFNIDKLKFKLSINCFDYKMINNEIVRGSNTYKVNQILLLTFKKYNDKWLMHGYDKIFEKKLGN